MRALRTIGIVLAVIGISFAATVILIWIRPEHAVSLLVYLPGIVIVEAVFGLEAGLGAVLLSVAGSAAYGIWFLPPPVPHPHQTVVREIILLIVGAFVVVLMELHRRSRHRVARGAQQLAAVLGNISDAVVIFGPDFRVRSMNAAAQAMFEARSETTVGRSAAEMSERFPFTPDGPPSGPQPLNLEAASRAGITVHEQGTIYDVRRKRRVQVLIHAIPW
ncbi:MAG: PAS domain-containing protein, partial [Terriglobales bacterium]